MNDIDIKQILEQFPDCINNGAKLKSILIDMYPAASKAIINTLVIIVNSGISKEIKNCSNVTRLEKTRWKKKLENDYGLAEKIIDSCLSLFLFNSLTDLKSSSNKKPKTTASMEIATSSDNETISTQPTYISNESRSARVTQDIKVGSKIEFGSYFQGESETEGKTPIKWIVIAKSDNRILVISEKALDCQKYNFLYADVTWQTCSLERWLNGAFLNSAFSMAEQSIIINPSNATKYKVFLLSTEAANKYFTSDEARKCVSTVYAKANGAFVSSSCTKKGEATCWWWLRSNSSSRNFAPIVTNHGSVYYACVNNDCVCVRPALMIDLSAAKKI